MVRVVVADDDRMMLQLLRHIVTDLGWDIKIAYNGADAFQMVEELVPDLVVADVEMPEMNGIDLARSMKSHPGLRQIPIVLMSSAGLEGLALASGSAAFIAKPFNSHRLAHLLLQVVQGETAHGRPENLPDETIKPL